MNLIEQLGGYEAVKGFYERAVKHGFELIEIRDALLEHRREHGIFEIGDWVVLVSPSFDSRICKVWNIGEITMSAKPIHPQKFNNNLKSVLINGVFIDSHKGWRHATPAEIAAGKRQN